MTLKVRKSQFDQMMIEQNGGLVFGGSALWSRVMHARALARPFPHCLLPMGFYLLLNKINWRGKEKRKSRWQ